MLSKLKELYTVSPWYIKIILVVVFPLALVIYIAQKVANVVELYNRGLFKKGAEKFDKKSQELALKEAKTEGALDEAEKENERKKAKVDTEDGPDLSDWLDDRE